MSERMSSEIHNPSFEIIQGVMRMLMALFPNSPEEASIYIASLDDDFCKRLSSTFGGTEDVELIRQIGRKLYRTGGGDESA